MSARLFPFYLLAALLLMGRSALTQAPAATLAMDDAVRAAADRAPEDTVRRVYLDFVYSAAVVESAQVWLGSADRLVEANAARVNAGLMAPIDVVSARAERATRTQQLIQATNTRRTSELALKRLMVAGTDDPLWSATLAPADLPGFEPSPADIDTAAARAQAVMSSATPPDAQAGAGALNVWNRAQSLRAAQATRNAAGQRLTEREQALQQGVAPNYDVVTAQRALNDAQAQLLQAVLDYRKALLEF